MHLLTSNGFIRVPGFRFLGTKVCRDSRTQGAGLFFSRIEISLPKGLNDDLLECSTFLSTNSLMLILTDWHNHP